MIEKLGSQESDRSAQLRQTEIKSAVRSLAFGSPGGGGRAPFRVKDVCLRSSSNSTSPNAVMLKISDSDRFF